MADLVVDARPRCKATGRNGAAAPIPCDLPAGHKGPHEWFGPYDGSGGRLVPLLVLADAERCDRARPFGTAWWLTKRHRKRVGDQLRRCLAVLEGPS